MTIIFVQLKNCQYSNIGDDKYGIKYTIEAQTNELLIKLKTSNKRIASLLRQLLRTSW